MRNDNWGKVDIPLVEICDDIKVITPEMENKLSELVKADLMGVNPELAETFEDTNVVNIPEEDADHLLEELQNEINEAYDNTLGNYRPIEDAIHECSCESKTVIPERGEMTLQGNVDDILRTISKLLDGRQVRLEVEWEVFG